MQNIFFFYEETPFRLTSELPYIDWINHVVITENKDIAGINYIFCSDEYLYNINVEYLNHDYYTDIITFDNSQEEQTIEADLFISIDRIRDNAKRLNVEFDQELRRVMVHGVLHLLGYNDKEDAEKEKMREKENAYLSLPQFKF